MKILALLLLAVVGVSASADIDIGTDEFPANEPFCADCAVSMRYQTLYLEEEIGTAMVIESIALKRTIQGDSEVTLDTLVIYMGYCDGDQLGNVFADNYRPGSMTEVLWEENFTVLAPDPNAWFYVDLETPFFYDGSGNLIVEYGWPDGHGAVFNYNWNDTIARSLIQGWGSSSGSTGLGCPHLRLSGTLSLEAITFGALKVLLGQ